MTDINVAPQGAQPAPQSGPQPQGFRGWLLLLAIGVCLSPLRTLIEFVQQFDAYGKAWNVANGRTLVLTEVGINLVLLGLEIVVMVAMLNRYRAFIKLFLWLWLAAFALPIVDIVVTVLLFPKVPNDIVVAEVGRTIVAVIVRGLWVWYVMVSVRMQNTFTR